MPLVSKYVDCEPVAKVCHEANRAYCATLGDLSQQAWDSAPDWQKSTAISGVDFHLAHLIAGTAASPSASHEAWMRLKRREGWKYGPVKNPETKEHPCFLPYEQLPIEQRLKDYIFAAIVEAFYKASLDAPGRTAAAS